MSDEAPKTVVLLCHDLMLESQAEAAACRAGATLITVGSPDAEIESTADGSAHTVIVDLSVNEVDLAELKTQFERHSTIRFLAFGPHVHKKRLQAARDAGFDAVLSRGQFHSQMQQWMTPPEGRNG